jgi:DNA-binding GntR family transcriptional regulator
MPRTRKRSSAAPADANGQALVEELAQQIQVRIMTGELAVGTRLRQEALAREFGVSRTPVREALRQLQAGGMITVEPNRGAVVRGPTPRDIRENYEVRAELEAYAAELASERVRDHELELMRKANEEFRALAEDYLGRDLSDRDEAAAGQAWMHANERFHQAILLAAENEQLIASVHDLFLRLPRNMTFRAMRGDSHLLRTNVREHEDIAAAIAARDPERARRAARVHLRRAADLVSRWYETESRFEARH